MYKYIQNTCIKFIIAGIIISIPLTGIYAQTLQNHSVLAPPVSSKPLASIQYTDSGLLEIIEDEAFLKTILLDFKKDAKQKYFNILMNQMEKLEFSRTGIKMYIDEHLLKFLPSNNLKIGVQDVGEVFSLHEMIRIYKKIFKKDIHPSIFELNTLLTQLCEAPYLSIDGIPMSDDWLRSLRKSYGRGGSSNWYGEEIDMFKVWISLAMLSEKDFGILCRKIRLTTEFSKKKRILKKNKSIKWGITDLLQLERELGNVLIQKGFYPAISRVLPYCSIEDPTKNKEKYLKSKERGRYIKDRDSLGAAINSSIGKDRLWIHRTASMGIFCNILFEGLKGGRFARFDGEELHGHYIVADYKDKKTGSKCRFFLVDNEKMLRDIVKTVEKANELGVISRKKKENIKDRLFTLNQFESLIETTRIEEYVKKEIIESKKQGQTFIDAARVRAYEAKRQDKNIIIGIELSFIPDGQRDDLQGILAGLKRLKNEEGLNNIIIEYGRGRQLIELIETARKIKNKDIVKTVSNSDIIFLGEEDVLATELFDAYRAGVAPEEWALFAGIDFPKGMQKLPENAYICLLEMLTKAVNLWAGKTVELNTPYLNIIQEGKRAYKFTLPEIIEYDPQTLKGIYLGQLNSMKSA